MTKYHRITSIQYKKFTIISGFIFEAHLYTIILMKCNLAIVQVISRVLLKMHNYGNVFLNLLGDSLVKTCITNQIQLRLDFSFVVNVLKNIME